MSENVSPRPALGVAVPGLWERLPLGEELVWRGSPSLAALSSRTFHLGGLAVYFGLLVGWATISTELNGASMLGIATAAAKFGGLAAVALGLVALFAWMVARSTVYVITSRRVVLKIGVCMPVTVNLPFRELGEGDLRVHSDGTGDITLQAAPSAKRLSYVLLWPHVRMWRFARPAVTLRTVPNAKEVASLLARAVAAAAVPGVSVTLGAPEIAKTPAHAGTPSAQSPVAA